MCFSERNAQPFNSNIKHSIRDKETAHLNPDMFSQGIATDRQIEFPFAQQAQPLRDPSANANDPIPDRLSRVDAIRLTAKTSGHLDVLSTQKRSPLAHA
jgi:hypothetical protein